MKRESFLHRAGTNRCAPLGRKGSARWDGKLVAKTLGDVDSNYVQRFLSKQKIDLAGRKSWCESKDPEFAAKAAEVVGLYMSPPDNALVLGVDEKTSIQALERAQGYLKLPTSTRVSPTITRPPSRSCGRRPKSTSAAC